MNKYFNQYVDGKLETGDLYFAEAVDGTEWGVDYRLIEDDIRHEDERCLVFRESNPMQDSGWKFGSFNDITTALEEIAEEWENWENYSED